MSSTRMASTVMSGAGTTPNLISPSAPGAVGRVWRFIVGPLVGYAACYAILTFPLILQFNRAFLTDRIDGYQMIWDVWWVRYAIVRLGRSPFTTPFLHYPFGTSLWLHTLTPFNGLLNLPLGAVFSPVHSFNILVLLAFAGSGLTAFLLCWKATRAYWPSLAGGFAFECCSYRWAHSFGHLNLISTEAMPLFLLGLLCLIARPRVLTGIGTAIALLVALLCDQYQFLYCVLATAVVLLWWGFSGRARRELLNAYLVCFAVFALASGLLCGPIVLAMLRATGHSPMHAHDADWYSADMLGPWVPDWAWVYSDWTKPLWFPSGSPLEKSVCLGPAVVIAAVFAFFPRRRAPRLLLGSAFLFAVLAAVFILLCFGPTWRFWDIPVTRFTPYRLLAFALPPLRFAGCTGRMIIMAQLAFSVLAAAGLSRIVQVRAGARRVSLIFLVAIAMFFESQPCVLLSCPPDVPHWVEVLRDAPGRGAVVDLVPGDQPIGLYYQTVYQRPAAMGDIFRLSVDTAAATATVLDSLEHGDFQRLSRQGFAYIVQNSTDPPLALPLFYGDRSVHIYLLRADQD